MAGRPKSLDDSKVFDVAKPEKSKPMGTSRPVIVSQASSIKDPTVIDVDGTDEPTQKLAPPSVVRKIISPLEDAETEAPTEPSQEQPATAPLVTARPKFSTLESETVTENASVAAVDIDIQNETPTEEASKTTSTAAPAGSRRIIKPITDTTEVNATNSTDETTMATDSETSGSDSAAVDALADATAKPKEEEKKAEEQAKKEAALQEIIDSKKYFVPLDHDSNQKTGSSHAWIVLLVIIILVSGAYAVVDAKVLKTSISLPYHIFKQ